MAPKFSGIEDEKLIEEVRKYRAIYDPEQKDYKDLLIKDAIWEKIGLVLEKSGEDCKVRWRNMKDNYFKHKNKKLGSGSAASYQPKWPLYKQLTFLDLVKNKRRTFSNVERAETSQSEGDEIISPEDESSQFSINSDPPSPICQESSLNKKIKFDVNSSVDSSPGTSRSNTSDKISKKQRKVEDLQGFEERSKKRLELLAKIANNEDDEVDLFFKSIALKVKKMAPHLITKTQLKVLAVVSEIEAEAQLFPTQAKTHSLPSQENSSSFPTEANSQAFPTQAKTHSLPSQENSSSFPTQANSQAFPTQAKTHSFPTQANSQSFTPLLNIQSFMTQPSTPIWTQDTSQISQYAPENYPNLKSGNETNASTSQHVLYQRSQELYPENP